MKTWTIARRDLLCGGRCEGYVRTGDPMLVIGVPGVVRPLVRCPGCAGEPIDADAIARARENGEQGIGHAPLEGIAHVRNLATPLFEPLEDGGE